MFIKGLNWDLSLLVKKTRVEWKSISISYLLNLENHLSKIQHKSLKRRLYIQLLSNKWRPLNETETPLVSNIIERAGPGIVINSKALGTFSPLTSFCNSITILNDRALRKNRDSYKAPLLINSEKHFSRLGMSLTETRKFCHYLFGLRSNNREKTPPDH